MNAQYLGNLEGRMICSQLFAIQEGILSVRCHCDESPACVRESRRPRRPRESGRSDGDWPLCVHAHPSADAREARRHARRRSLASDGELHRVPRWCLRKFRHGPKSRGVRQMGTCCCRPLDTGDGHYQQSAHLVCVSPCRRRRKRICTNRRFSVGPRPCRVSSAK